MMASTSSSKKRKRGAEDADNVSVELSTASTSQVGPVLVSFPAVQPSKSTTFQCYSRSGTSTVDDFTTSQDVLVAGETPTVEFFTAAEPGSSSAGCSYYVAVHNKKTKTTTLRPAPLHLLTQQVKALKNLEALAVSVDERMALRTNLGEAFGTKKAKAAIRARERNRMDVDAMQGVTAHIQDTIMENTGSLPTTEEAKETADSSRLIPSYNAAAQRPEDVYPIHNIIPETEFTALPDSILRNASSHKERLGLLPYRKSDWVSRRLQLAFGGPKPKSRDLKILLYISALFAFKMSSRKLNDKQALQERLQNIPSVVVDGLLARFTETVRNTTEFRTTSQTETSLLTHMFALCLRIDDFAADVALIAHDLSMPVSKVEMLFKSLGCKVRHLDTKELKNLGLPNSDGESKRAVLTVPLEFPATRTRRARR